MAPHPPDLLATAVANGFHGVLCGADGKIVWRCVHGHSEYDEAKACAVAQRERQKLQPPKRIIEDVKTSAV